MHANALFFCSASVSCRKAETISLIQIQTVFQNTTGENVGNCAEDGVFRYENTKESEEISCAGHEGVEVVKSDEQKHNDKERKIDHLIDSIDDGIAENRTDDFAFADNLSQTDGEVKVYLLANSSNDNGNHHNRNERRGAGTVRHMKPFQTEFAQVCFSGEKKQKSADGKCQVNQHGAGADNQLGQYELIGCDRQREAQISFSGHKVAVEVQNRKTKDYDAGNNQNNDGSRK